MLDPFAAISFAGNILQFIEFATKLVREGKEVYHSANGAIQEHVDLELITLDLKQLTDPLTPPYRYSPKGTSHNDKRLCELAAACQRTSEELLQLLQELKFPQTARHLKLESIRIALRTSLERKQIDELRGRLDSFRNTLNTHFLEQLRNQESGIAKMVREVCNESRNLQIHTAKALERTRIEIIKDISEMNERNQPHGLFMTAIMMAEFGEAGTRALKEQTILRSLHFATIKVRFEDVKPAHAKTFEWAYHDNKIYLKQWLEAETGIFWVTGKAGSGKSTFMKFLFHRQETRIGPEMVLQQAPELIPTVCPERWNDINERENVWTLSELSGVFQTLGQQASLPVKLCLFVDGLDEFEPSVKNGDHKDLLQVLKNIAVSSDIKLCLSSRPWPFVLSELSRAERELYMQDLTVNDMRMYVQDMLESQQDFRSLRMREPECVRLISEISARAQGVFLWVYLVTRSLLKGLEGRDTTAELQKRLDALPEGLEGLFERAIRSIEPAYQAQSARILRTAVAAHEPLSVLTYHFLEVESGNSEYAMEENVDLPKDQKSLCERMRRRLHARSKDLLEVSRVNLVETVRTVKVNFLHRTVKEFLEGSPDVAAMLQARTTGFDPRTTLCKSFLAQIKTLPKAFSPTDYFPLVDDLLYYAREAEIYNRATQADILDELDRCLKKRTVHMKEHWTSFRPHDGHSSNHNPCDFLGFAIQARQNLYVKEKLSEDRSLLSSKTGRPCLDHALRPTFTVHSTLPHYCGFADPDMVRMLLDLGADPNLPSTSQGNLTPWVMFLMFFEREQDGFAPSKDSGKPRLSVKTLVKVVDLLLKHGADPAPEYDMPVTNNGTTVQKKLSAAGVLGKILSADDVLRLLGATEEPELPPPRGGLTLKFSKLRKSLRLRMKI